MQIVYSIVGMFIYLDILYCALVTINEMKLKYVSMDLSVYAENYLTNVCF